MVEQSVEQLKARAELMGKYYFRGFGNFIQIVVANAQIYLLYPEDRVEVKKETLDAYSLIEELYKKIPFEELKDNEDFKPIFSARDLLPEYKQALDSFFEAPTEEKENILDKLGIKILETVEPYRENFWGLTKKIRSISENENFYVKVIDWNGVEWRF